MTGLRRPRNTGHRGGDTRPAGMLVPYAYAGDQPASAATLDQELPDDRCGSYAGWNAHQRDGTPVCGPCGDARNAYMQAWRLATGRTRTIRVAPSPAVLALLRGGRHAR